MAKQRTSYVERHVEKGVVVLTAALLAWVLMTFVVKSPNRIDLKGKAVGPGEVDGHLAATAEQVLAAMNRGEPPVLDIEDYPDRQQLVVKGLLANDSIPATLAPSVPLGPPVPEVQGPGVQGQLKLADLIAPDPPVVRTGRYSAYISRASAVVGDEISDLEHEQMIAAGPRDVSWVSIAARFDVKAQEKRFLDADYQTEKFRVRLTAADVQRQIRLPDGDWSEWEDIPTYRPHYFEPVPVMNLVEEPGTEPPSRTIPIDDRRAFLTWLQERDEFGFEVLRPHLPEKWDGEDWVPPLCRALRDTYPDEGFACPAPTVDDGGRRLNDRQRALLELELARELFAKGELDAANELAGTIVSNLDYPRETRVEAQELQVEVISALEIRDLAREEAAENAESGNEAPQRPEEFVLLHDLEAPDGEQVRYRVRVRSVNEYAMELDRLKQPEDAVRPFIESEWSAPSAPIDVPALKRIYATNVKNDGRKIEAKFDLFLWTRGEWVKASVTTRLGQAVGGVEKTQHFGEGKKIDVDFATGLTLVGLNEERPYVPAESSRDGGLIVEETPQPSASVLLVGPDRRMTELFVEAGRDDPLRKQIQDEMRAAKQGRRGGG